MLLSSSWVSTYQITTWNILLPTTHVNQIYWEKRFVSKNLQYKIYRESLALLKYLYKMISIWMILRMPLLLFLELMTKFWNWKSQVSRKKFFKLAHENKTASNPVKFTSNFSKYELSDYAKKTPYKSIENFVLHLGNLSMLTI